MAQEEHLLLTKVPLTPDQPWKDDPDHVQDHQHSTHSHSHQGCAVCTILMVSPSSWWTPETDGRTHIHSAHLQELLFMMDSTHRHPHTPKSAHLQDLPLNFQNKYDCYLIIAKQETDLTSRSCAILPWTSSKACPLLHPLPGEELCPTARLSLLARTNSAAPRCSSIF